MKKIRKKRKLRAKQEQLENKNQQKNKNREAEVILLDSYEKRRVYTKSTC